MSSTTSDLTNPSELIDPGDPLPRFNAGPLGRIILMSLLTFSVLVHVIEINSRGIDPDELEHLHAAYLVWLGDVPYRDFFEHHAPALYYFAKPLFSLHGPELAVLWGGRTCMWLCSLGILALTGQLARRVGGPGMGLPAATLLALSTVFHLKAIEFRPDVPAALLLLGAVLAWTSAASSRRVFLAGMLAGLATLFTQKSLIPTMGLWLGQMILLLFQSDAAAPGDLHQTRSARLSTAVRSTLYFALGGALPWGLTFGLFATAGAADDLWRGAVYQLWVWPMRSNRLETFLPVFVSDLGLYSAALLELTWRLRQRCRSQRSAQDEPELIVVMVALLWCLLSLTWVKAVYAQYYFLWQPLLAVVAAKRLTDWSRSPDNIRFVLTVGIPALVLSVLQLLLWFRAVESGSGGALASLSPWLDRLSPAIPWCLLMLLGSTLFAASQGHRRRAVLYFTILAQFYGLLRMTEALFWSNAHQVHVIETLHQHVPPQGRVLDGFSGAGALRRHALYYWWINDYSRALMQRLDDEARVLPELQRNPPNAILFDTELEKLPAEVLDWIKEHYEPSADLPFWMPKAKPSL